MEIVPDGCLRVVVDATVNAPALARVLAVPEPRWSRFWPVSGYGWQRTCGVAWTPCPSRSRWVLGTIPIREALFLRL